jgi:tetraacyldisaccharide 4'-kinase
MLYRLVLAIRHLAYDKGWKKSFTASVPTVCIGNITVGGTGKTPHTEMILRKLLGDSKWGGKKLAILSRGYKRKSRGYQIANPDSTARQLGDEPLQMARKFPMVTVAVDKNRVRGCQQLDADLIILDDAFQYRKLKATLNIVLVDYGRPIFEDRLMPFGHLRDLPSQIRRADVVIVSKCPAELDTAERDQWRSRLGLAPEQKLFFTTVSYCQPEPVFPEADPHYIYSKRLVLVSGIANNSPLKMYLSDTYKIVQKLEFPDHHNFTSGDIRSIEAAVKDNPTACLMTTEKDAQRLRDCKKVPDSVRQRLFFTPIQSTFLSEEEEREFDSLFFKHLVLNAD